MCKRSDIKPLPSLERLNELDAIAARLKAAEELHGQFLRVA